METLKYESNLAVAGIIFNLGDVEGTKHIFNKCQLELPNNFIERLREYEEKGEKNKALWMSKKGEIRRNRFKNLAKYQTKSKGRKKQNEIFDYIGSQKAGEELSWDVMEELAEERRTELESKERKLKEEAKEKKKEEKQKEREEKKLKRLEEKERKKRERVEEKEAKKAVKKSKL